MVKLKYYLIAIILFNSSFSSLAQLDSVFHQGPSIGSVTSGALQTTDNFGNQPILSEEPKIIPNPENPYSERLIVPTDKSSLPPYAYIEDPNATDDPHVVNGQTVLLRKFPGIAMNNYIPPDPIIAAGPNHIVACVNGQFNIWDKAGNLLKVIPAGDWWAPVWPDAAADPQVIYDHYAGRWVITWMQVNLSAMTAGNLIAYSDDNNPLGIWYMYRLDTKKHGTVNSDTWGDYPQLGFDDEAIYITTRCFNYTGFYSYNKIRIINKAELYSSNGGVVAYTDFWNIRQSSSPSSSALDGIHPSYCYTPEQGGYFFWANRNGGNYYVLYRVLDPISNNPRLRGYTLSVQYYYKTPNANQLGGGFPLIESNGSSVKTAPIIRDGKMYITHSIRNSTSPSSASVKYVIYDLTSNLITDQAELGAIGYYYIFPTITVDKDHNIAVTYSRSSDSEYIGGYYSTKHAVDPPGLSPSQPLAQGQGNYIVTYGGTRNRWGDYLGIFLDPNEYDVWIFPEYAAATNTWGTYVGQIRMASYSGPYVYANPLEIDFGFVEVGQMSDTLSTIIANYGDTDLIITDLPSSIGDFNFLTNLSFPYTLSSYDSLMLEFNFAPTDTGQVNVIYSLVSNDPSFTGFTFTGNGTPEQPFQLTVNVTNGWNMVSAPGVNPDGQGVEFWWPGKDPAANVFKYGTGYQPIDTVTPGEGYWMKHLGANIYETGDEWPAGGIQKVSHEPITGISGWNLFGGYELFVGTAGITTVPSGLQNSPVYKYGAGYEIATTLEPGYGYWIKLTGTGQIIIPEVLAKLTEPVEFFREDWGKIILTDASGINYTLYAVTGDVDLNKYELPPMPPTGMFDIRYGSGRIAEDINSSLQTIEMSGVTYPLTVRAEGMDMRLMDETGKTINVNLKSGEDVVISDATIQKLQVTGELIPAVYALEQNYPNPFNPSTVIEFSLPEDVSNVKLLIYNALGEKVAELVNSSLTAGKNQYQWNAKNVATGIYIYELRTDKFVSVKKMVLMK